MVSLVSLANNVLVSYVGDNAYSVHVKHVDAEVIGGQFETAEHLRTHTSAPYTVPTHSHSTSLSK